MNMEKSLANYKPADIIKVGKSYFYTQGGFMKNASFVDDAKVMSKGQVTIPKNVRSVLGVETGDRVTFIVEGLTVRVMNSAAYALLQFQNQMKGKASEAGFMTEEDIAEWITNSRRSENG